MTMDDRFMHGLKREPAAEFDQALRARLRREEEAAAERREPSPAP